LNQTVLSNEELIMMLKAFKERQGKRFRLRSLGVFGSFARGEGTADSDIDIVFETDEPNLFRTAVMKEELEALLARRVDVVRWREGMNPRLRARIVREALYV
jgi:uncharacterized protein